MELSACEKLKRHGKEHFNQDVEKACNETRGFSKSPNAFKINRLDSLSTLDWMGLLDDDTPLTSITIPGTHDSSAYTISWPFVSTQKLDFLSQLNTGIRYFDLRCAIRDDVVQMVHGPTFLGVTLQAVLDTMYTWLAEHPTEALICQIKRDRRGQRSTVHLSQAIFSMIAERPERWRTENTVPSLGTLRGRIQLFRRFVDDNLYSFGVDVTEWQDNPRQPFTIYTQHGVRVTIQDHYNFADPQPLPDVIVKKGGNVLNLLRRAAADKDPDHWYINFTSAFEFNLYYQLTPREVAIGGYYRFRWEHGMNVRLRTTLLEMGGRKKHLGIVAMDFPEQGAEDLIPALIQTNFDLEEPKSLSASRLLIVILVLVIIMLTGLFAGGDIWQFLRLRSPLGSSGGILDTYNP